MATTIYWFSGTGNSLRVAKALQDGLDDATLVPIARAVHEEAPSTDHLALVFPVYAWGPPKLVERFIGKLPTGVSDDVYAVFTHGGSCGSTAKVTRRLLRGRGLDLSAAWAVRMVENYPPFGGAPGEDKRVKRLSHAETRIQEIVGEARRGRRGVFDQSGWLFRVFGPVIHRMFMSRVSRADRKFFADERCNQCGLCGKVCPVGNIELVDDRPTWLGRCEQCFACFHFCPQNAIQYGKKTARQVRYHHPNCAAADLVIER